MSGPERDHAVRTKRLREGEILLLLDGRGTIASARVTRAARTLDLEILSCELTPGPTTDVEICCPAPKAQRASTMIDLLSQAGASAWRPLQTAYTEQPITPARCERLGRVAQESLKQCRRPWLMEIREPISFEDALGDDARLILADASGAPLSGTDVEGESSIRVLIGPEGGWRDDELELARERGAKIARFGPHVMRVETAACVACATLLDRLGEIG
ncbi:MAG: RsmE family RNA methyltransferase [Planctomycetota bacterium]